MNTSTIHAFKYNDCNKIRTKQTECYDDRLSSKKKEAEIEVTVRKNSTSLRLLSV